MLAPQNPKATTVRTGNACHALQKNKLALNLRIAWLKMDAGVLVSQGFVGGCGNNSVEKA